MILYLSIIVISAIIVSIMNISFVVPKYGVSPLLIICFVVVSVLYEFLIDAVFAIIANKIPEKSVKDKKFFRVSKREQQFYVKLKIRSWKDKVWELGRLNGFSKAKVENPTSVEYAERFLTESFKGEIDHILGMITGYSVIFILPFKYILSISVPIATVNLILNLMSFMVLRYNTPKLMALRTRAIRLSERKEEKING